MNFATIPGVDSVKNKLIATVKENRISHAQLFDGPEGSAALAMALAYAKMVHCDAPTELDACGICPHCVQHEKLAHPDLHFVFPVAKTSKSSDKPTSEEFLTEWRAFLDNNPFGRPIDWLAGLGIENKQAIITVNEARRIVEKLQLKSYSGKHKILLVWQPEKFNTESANKLLKTIEEPEGQTLILLITHDQESILTTINSRVQRTGIPSLSNDEIARYLQTQLNTEYALAQLIAECTSGSLGEAITLVKQPEILRADAERFVEWMRLCFRRKVKEVLDWSDDTASMGRERTKSFLLFSLNALHSSFRSGLGMPVANPFSIVGTNFSFDNFSKYVQPNNLPGMVEELEKAIYDIQRNGNAKIVIFDLSMRIITLIRVNA